MNKVPLKTRIANSSLQLFGEHGYHGVSVHQIVEHAGTSKGGFYYNFQSKEQVLYEIHNVFISYVIEKAEKSYIENDTPISKLNGILHSFMKVFDIYTPYIVVFYEESAYLQGNYKKLIKKKRDRYRVLIETVIQEGQASGDFRKEIPANIATMAIIGMMNWTYKWYKKDGPLTVEQITNAFKDLIFHSLMTEQGLTEASFFLCSAKTK